MNEDTLSEWEALAKVAPAEEYTKDAEKKAAALLGRMVVVAASKDEQENDSFFTNVILKHKDFWRAALAKRYQTLIDEGKI